MKRIFPSIKDTMAFLIGGVLGVGCLFLLNYFLIGSLAAFASKQNPPMAADRQAAHDASLKKEKELFATGQWLVETGESGNYSTSLVPDPCRTDLFGDSTGQKTVGVDVKRLPASSEDQVVRATRLVDKLWQAHWQFGPNNYQVFRESSQLGIFHKLLNEKKVKIDFPNHASIGYSGIDVNFVYFDTGSCLISRPFRD